MSNGRRVGCDGNDDEELEDRDAEQAIPGTEQHARRPQR